MLMRRKGVGMLTIDLNDLDGFPGVKCRLIRDTQPISFANFLDGLQTNDQFRVWFNRCLATSPFKAFRWELPALTANDLSSTLEFVLVDSPSLDRTPDSTAFASHFRRKKGGAIAFPNLGRDAVLVVPCPDANANAYGHLGAFVRGAPEVQRDEFWLVVGLAMRQRINAKPVWLNTAGAGVPWLHVRLDDRSKYYHYQPYR